MSSAATAGGTILLVEDEEDIATLVRTYLERDGFEVVWAARGVEGLLALERHDICLAILDLQLPDADGLDLCRAIREQSRLPIVIVTARDEEIDRITGLELGADDYVTKPFSPRELVARVRAVLRRTAPAAEDTDVVSAGDVVLERGGRTVTVGEQPVELTGKEFDLLAFLLDHPGYVMSRERLLDQVWGLEFAGGTRTVDVHVAQVRKKLGRPGLIRTVRGSGYKSSPPADTAAPAAALGSIDP
jgi:DNA-binding response OmpR family regulator